MMSRKWALKGTSIVVAGLIGVTASAQDGAPLSQDVVIDLTPGLYLFETVVTLNGMSRHNYEPYSYCITPDRARTSLNAQLNKFSEGGECEFSRVAKTSHSANGDFSCYVPDFGVNITGQLEGDYSPKHYRVSATAPTPMGEHKSVVTATWQSPCPAGWTPPPNISHE